MVDSNEPTTETTPPKPVRRRAAVRPAGPPAELVAEAPAAPAKKAAAKTTAAKKTYKSLQIDFQIFGDHIELHEDEIRLMDPAYHWAYW